MEFNKKYIFFISLIFILGIGFLTLDKMNFFGSEERTPFTGKLIQQISREQLLVNDALSLENPKISSIAGYDGDEVWVSVKGVEMTLNQALDIKGLCGATSLTTVYSAPKQPYHYADEIEISAGNETKSLQDAINDGQVLKTVNHSIKCYGDDEYYYDSCNFKGSFKEDCSQVPSCTDYGEWYCSSSTTAKSDKTCYTGSCSNLTNRCVDNLYKEFQSDCGIGWTCEPQLNGDDCYKDWKEVEVLCTEYNDFVKNNTDCNNDFDKPYTCTQEVDVECTDYDFIREISGGHCETTSYLYRERTVKCKP